MLEKRIFELRKKRGILLMPHLVLGCPSFDENRRLIATMVGAGADIIEMQIPFSEPMADGPVIMKANDEALKNGTNTTQCLDFAKSVCAEHPDTIFVFMTYYNIPFTYGVLDFVKKTKAAGVGGLIIPDLPPEEASEYMSCCYSEGVDPIFIFTPTSKPERLKHLSQFSRGMIYCVGRKGVTGIKTQIDDKVSDLIKLYRSSTDLPLAFGFGIQEKSDVDRIANDVDIAVIGTKILTLHQEGGVEAVGTFLKNLRK